MEETIIGAIERLEAEKRRRIDERVARGELVRVSLGDPDGIPVIVVGADEDPDEKLELAKARKIAELRAAGDRRAVIFDTPEDAVTMILTGVPRGPDSYNPADLITEEDKAPCPEDFSARRRVREALSAVDKPMPTTPAPASAEEPAEPLVHRPIYAQVAPPTESDPGQIIEGSFTISSGGIVRVEDDQGILLGSEVLQPGADPAAVARRILRDKRSPGFWGPISYA
jgi:hypothetical protein